MSASSPPVSLLPGLPPLSAEELSAEVQGIRRGRERHLPTRLSAPAVLTLARQHGREEEPGRELHTLARGGAVARYALLADVLAVLSAAEGEDAARLTLLREWVETQP